MASRRRRRPPRQFDWLPWAAGFVVILLVLWIIAGSAFGQHHHPPEHAQLHDQFYRHLLRPDTPGAQPGSCCGNMDCYPTQAEYRRGQWWAVRREDKSWIPVPNERVIEGEISPDARAHLCATATFVYCFIKPDSGV